LLSKNLTLLNIQPPDVRDSGSVCYVRARLEDSIYDWSILRHDI
jgi:hypothetical protein